MKYRLIATAVLVAVLGAVAALMSDDRTQSVSAPAGADDAAMKSLNIN